MAQTLPNAKTRIQPNAGASGAGTELIAILAAVALNADTTPRIYANYESALAQHSYNHGIEYAALHVQETGKQFVFVGLPIAVQGVIGRVNSSGNSGTSVISLTAGSNGPLGETDGVLSVIKGGTVGTDKIVLGLSLDGGRTTKSVRIGTDTSYTIPYLELTVGLTVGTLVEGDIVYRWHTTAPRWDSAGLQAARLGLAAKQIQARTWLVEGDLLTEDDAVDVVTEANAYETTNDRFIGARCAVRDRLPLATLSQSRVRMTGNPNLTFAEVGGTGDTITRSSGSWIDDGFAPGMTFAVTGSVSNNVTGVLAAVSATVLTLGTTDLANEGPVGNVTVTATPTLTFAEVGATGDTLTRSHGSWLDDGFRIGDLLTIAGTASNNLTASAGLANVTTTVLTFGTTDLAAEVIGSYGVTITAGETKAQHLSNVDDEFSDVASEPRINLGFGRARMKSPILGYRFRRPSQWFVALRSFQHDVQTTTWEKERGPLSGVDLEDADGNLAEWDDRVDGGAIQARFTCLRTWGNDEGVFVAMDLTRDDETSLLSLQNNMDVANVGCSTVQRITENFVGKNLVLAPTGKASTATRTKLEDRVNSALKIALLQEHVPGEGPRASSARWAMSTDDILNVPDAKITGKLSLLLNGVVVSVETVVVVQSGGG
jgi:hypothetical protein